MKSRQTPARNLERADEDVRRGRGRPRDEAARQRILEAALKLLAETSFAEVTIDAIAERARVGKATVYRWWPNKAELVIAAFISVVEEQLRFSSSGPFEKAIHDQMKNWVPVYRSPLGQVITTVIGAGQSEPEIMEAFRKYWVEPRRHEARESLRLAIKEGRIHSGLDPDTIIDLFYGPLYLRLLITNAPLTPAYVDLVFHTVIRGLRP